MGVSQEGKITKIFFYSIGKNTGVGGVGVDSKYLG